MLYLLLVLNGAFIMYFLLQKPIKIQVHHIHEDVKEQLSREEIASLEEAMNPENARNNLIATVEQVFRLINIGKIGENI